VGSVAAEVAAAATVEGPGAEERAGATTAGVALAVAAKGVVEREVAAKGMAAALGAGAVRLEAKGAGQDNART
jgi:hypothetical protein